VKPKQPERSGVCFAAKGSATWSGSGARGRLDRLPPPGLLAGEEIDAHLRPE
jgi:hypothetical protein